MTFYWMFIVVGIFAVLSFIGFLGSISTTVYAQHFNADQEKLMKVNMWTVKFNFIKNLFWQWTIYLFAFVCAIVIILNIA